MALVPHGATISPTSSMVRWTVASATLHDEGLETQVLRVLDFFQRQGVCSTGMSYAAA